MPLTPRQKEVLDFIAGFVGKKGYCPSYEEIAAGLELTSLGTVHKHIEALQAKNYIRRSYNHSRSLELSDRYFDETRASRSPMEVPLEGRIAAGAPIESFADRETLNFADFAGDRDTYALEVRGDSMIEDHICSGDFVLIERAAQIHNGDVVVALVRGSEATLKRFYKEPDGMIRLQPSNAAMEPIRIPASELEIQGRLLAVLRKYR
jgi:repressor LexA